MAKRKPRIIQLGFHRCGTTTLWRFFERNGLKCAHMDGGPLVREIQKNIDEGRPPLKGASEQYDFLSCMQSIDRKEYLTPFKNVATFANAYPEALFILNVRKLEYWLDSRARHWDHAPVPYIDRFLHWMDLASFSGHHCKIDVFAYWRQEWNKHNKETRTYFAKRPKLRFVDFNFDHDGPEKLIAAAPEWKLDASKWRHMNRARDGAYSDKPNA